MNHKSQDEKALLCSSGMWQAVGAHRGSSEVQRYPWENYFPRARCKSTHTRALGTATGHSCCPHCHQFLEHSHQHTGTQNNSALPNGCSGEKKSPGATVSPLPMQESGSPSPGRVARAGPWQQLLYFCEHGKAQAPKSKVKDITDLALPSLRMPQIGRAHV